LREKNPLFSLKVRAKLSRVKSTQLIRAQTQAFDAERLDLSQRLLAAAQGECQTMVVVMGKTNQSAVSLRHIPALSEVVQRDKWAA
jgi:hypothetical protein